MIFSALILDWGIALALSQRRMKGSTGDAPKRDPKEENKLLLYTLLAGVAVSLLPYVSMLFDPTYILEFYLILRLVFLMIAVIPAVILVEKR
jgi:Mn2+/Fe2+ NRAMP family transporter